MIDVHSFVAGAWIGPGPGAQPLADAATGEIVARAGDPGADPGAMLDFARERGGPALRAMTFHDRARMLKALALHLQGAKDRLYGISYATGATRKDHAFDIDGGIGTLFVYASKGRREMPDGHVLRDGALEPLGREGCFLGQHVYVSRPGVAVHINAFNFPVWGMLEKLAPSVLAGMPCIVKPATVTCYVTALCVRLMLESGILPEGALQMVTGRVDGLLDALGPQDSVTFTGSAATALRIKSRAALIEKAVPVTAEQDSLNASILGLDAGPGTPEFDLFVKEVLGEITTKAGQKCTAIRRILVPEARLEAVSEALCGALSERLRRAPMGDPRAKGVGMGPLVSLAQRADVLAQASKIESEAELIFTGETTPLGADAQTGAFVAPQLYLCHDPDGAEAVHREEAFGPIATLMPYRDLDHAIALANRGGGSLVTSLVTHDPEVARAVVLGAGAFHGRIYINDRTAMAEATGHGAPMPHMTHGGPGRAGGGEELGGLRAVTHLMQRVAVQGSPDMLTALGGAWVPGGAVIPSPRHPFRETWDALRVGQTLRTEARMVTLADIEHFAQFTGDTFYAHMDDEAAARNPFFPGRVAHGYLLLSFAAGLFVDPDEGPVLANTGLEDLRFLQPVSPGDSIRVALTVQEKRPRIETHGEIRWHVAIETQEGATVATYTLLTMVARDKAGEAASP